MRPSLANLTAVHHQNFIRILDSREPMRDDNRSPILHQTTQRILNQNFCLGVNARSRFI